MKWPLRNIKPTIPPQGHVGDFAFRRSYYHHPGIDLYCADLQPIQSIESGIITNLEIFTGPKADPPSPWWLETFAIMIEGFSGAIGYCELFPFSHLKVGDYVAEGENIGLITPVLKKDKGNGRTMLHLEHYLPGTKHHETWILDQRQPGCLLNPRPLLEKIIHQLQ